MPLKRHDRNMFCFSLCYRWSVRITMALPVNRRGDVGIAPYKMLSVVLP